MKPFLLSAGFLFFVVNLPSLAQSVQGPRRPADGGTSEVLISILIPSTPNAPFTATVNTEWIRQLADGTTITLKNHRAIARDSAGRIFQERRVLVPVDAKGESALTQTEISDPLSHDLYICRPEQLVCQVEVFSPPSFQHAPAVVNAHKRPDGSGVEDLGTQQIGGLETTGQRETTTVPVGALGNDRPLVAKREFWYSSALGVNLISKRQDPRFGTQNFEVTNIVLGEPDPNLFKVPVGSKVIDLRQSASE